MKLEKCGECKFLSESECSLGMLERFRAKGVEVSEDDNGNPVVHRACLRKKPPGWEGDLEESLRQKVDVILVEPTDEMLASLEESTVKPSSVVLVVANDGGTAELVERYKEMREKSKAIDLPTTVIMVLTTDPQVILKEAASKCLGTFFVRLQSGRKLPPTLISEYNELIVEDLEIKLLLRDKNTGENWGMNYGLHVSLQGGPLEELETIVGEEYQWLR